MQETRTGARGTVAITGASGFVGSALGPFLSAAGYAPLPFARAGSPSRRSRAPSAAPGAAPAFVAWDPARGDIDAAALGRATHVVNLAGESVVGLWTAAKKRRIQESRVAATSLLARTLAALPTKPSVLVSASAIGVYPDVGDRALDESAAPGDHFLAEVCKAWEAATRPAEDAGIRVVHLRIGIVLAPHGGALQKMLPPFRLGLGGVIGGGAQYMSWIALPDLLRAIRFCLETPTLVGPVNAVAPNPVTNRDFTHALGRAVRRPTVFPIPAFVLKAGAGEFSTEALSSHRIVPAKLTAAGFSFETPTLDAALARVLAPSRAADATAPAAAR